MIRKMIAKIAAHKIIATIVTVVVVGSGVAIGSGAVGVFNGGGNGNTCNGSCGTSVPISGQSGRTTGPAQERVDQLHVCENNSNNQFGPIVEPDGQYCMDMIIPVIFNGSEVTLTTLRNFDYSSLPIGNQFAWIVKDARTGQIVSVTPLIGLGACSTRPNDLTCRSQKPRVGPGQTLSEQKSPSVPNVVPDPWTGGLCWATPDGSLVNRENVVQCGISDQSYPFGWDQLSGPGLTKLLPGDESPSTFSGQTMPMLTLQGAGCNEATAGDVPIMMRTRGIGPADNEMSRQLEEAIRELRAAR